MHLSSALSRKQSHETAAKNNLEAYILIDVGFLKVNGEVAETTDYILAGKKIIGMQKGEDRLLFHYDESGSLIMLRINGTPYTYVKNLQGDIVGLIDNTGALIVEYKYDAWGNPLSTRTLTSEYDALAELNPFRYRGYVWDVNTERYYVSSRYYKSEYLRWINADGYVSTGQGFIGCNMYAYCNNSPLILKDSSGHRAKVSYEELPYDSADEAAIAFYEEVQSVCLYTHHEFGTYIYSRTIGVITTYGYTPPVVGQPHNISISDLFVPEDGKIVALAHTHWETDTFSGMDSREEKGDLVMVRNTNYDMYVVGPGLMMYKYFHNDRTIEEIETIEISPLTYDEKYITYYTLENNWNIHRSVCEQCQKYEEINLIPEG